MDDVRLIDANALAEEFIGGECMKSMAEAIADKRFAKAIRQAPTIDSVVVVHARWEYVNCGGVKKPGFWRCTACKHEPPGGMMRGDNYCSFCGAKMDERR